jgi:hypothetical protein
MTPTPMLASKALDAHFLEIRHRLLDLAAALDRIGRGQGAAALANDPRLEKIRQAVDVLRDMSGGRAERVQRIFSLDYELGWERPQPR